MRSFLISSLVFLLIAAALVAGLSKVANTLAPTYERGRRRLELFEEHRNQIEVLGVGSSHGTSLDFEAMEVSGFHFWTPGQDAFELLSRRPRAPGTVGWLEWIYARLAVRAARANRRACDSYESIDVLVSVAVASVIFPSSVQASSWE